MFDDLKISIAAHIKQAEAKTDSEIIVVLAKKSDNYYYIPTLWAAIMALILPILVLIYQLLDGYFGFNHFTNSYDYNAAHTVIVFQYYVYMLQLLCFILGFSILHFTKLKYALIPKSVKINRARLLACEQFMAQALDATDNRAGVLLFLSLAEQYVEIIADKKTYEMLDNAIWQNIIDALIRDIKADNMQAGLTQAVDALGAILARHLPKSTADGGNKLDDHLIIIE